MLGLDYPWGAQGLDDPWGVGGPGWARASTHLLGGPRGGSFRRTHIQWSTWWQLSLWGKRTFMFYLFCVLGRFLAKVGPKTLLSGSGSENGAERT